MLPFRKVQLALFIYRFFRAHLRRLRVHYGEDSLIFVYVQPATCFDVSSFCIESCVIPSPGDVVTCLSAATCHLGELSPFKIRSMLLIFICLLFET